MLRFHFPIVIIDEDYRSENTSGLGIRALAQAIEREGFEVLGVTSYGDLSSFAQQQSRASAFIHRSRTTRFSTVTPVQIGDVRSGDPPACAGYKVTVDSRRFSAIKLISVPSRLRVFA